MQACGICFVNTQLREYVIHPFGVHQGIRFCSIGNVVQQMVHAAGQAGRAGILLRIDDILGKYFPVCM